MIDRWEHQYGLDVLNHTPHDLDADGDGLDLFDEYLNGTDPNNNDSDGDGTDDQDEVDQGSDPTNGDDGGNPPPADTTQQIAFTVGDPSRSNSERWQMRIIGLGPDTRTLLLANEEFGTVTPSTQKTLWKNTSYRIELQHLGTNIPAKQGGPDYEVRYDVLGRGIPALSYAAGQGAIPTLGLANSADSQNFNMEVYGRDSSQWPTDGHSGDGDSGRWLHNDFINVGLPYLYQTYEAIINRGGLDETETN